MASNRRVYRWTIPVDDHEHSYELTGWPIHVDAQSRNLVEFWTEEILTEEKITRTLIVVRTGHPVGDHWIYIGTTKRIEGFIWHLYVVAAQ